MIRVTLPFHLCTLARVDGEVELRVEDSRGAAIVLDSLETNCLAAAHGDVVRMIGIGPAGFRVRRHHRGGQPLGVRAVGVENDRVAGGKCDPLRRKRSFGSPPR